MFDLLVVSDCILDLYYRVKYLPIRVNDVALTSEPVPSPGGACNVAVVASKLGLKVAVVDALGDDYAAELLMRMLNEAGVYTGLIRRVKGAYTSISNNIIDDKGRHAFIGFIGAGKHLKPTDADENIVKESKAIFISGFNIPHSATVRETVMKIIEAGLRDGSSLFLDPGPAAGVIRSHIPNLTRVFKAILLNDSEAKALYNSGFRDSIRLMRGSGGTFVVKLGGKGALLISGGEATRCPATKPSRIITTVGAGDAFNAAYITGVLRGLSDLDSCRFANQIASIRLGVLSIMDFPNMPNAVAEFLNTHRLT